MEMLLFLHCFWFFLFMLKGCDSSAIAQFLGEIVEQNIKALP